MWLKFAFQNKIFVNILFFIFIFLSLIGFLFSFSINKNKFDIPLFSGVDADIRINIEDNKSKVFINDIEVEKDYSPFLYDTYVINNFPVYKISLSNNDFKTIVVSLGYKNFFYRKNDVKTKDEKGNYILDIKYDKNSKYITDKLPLKHFFTNFLSIFYNFKFHIFSIFCLAVSILIFLNNKEKINIKFNLLKNNAILWILILGLILRLSDLSPSFWGDELYTYNMASKLFVNPLIVFSDPGNPPFFYILSGLIYQISNKIEVLRGISVLFSVLSIYFIWFFVKNSDNKRTAVISSFLFSINIYALVSAQEFRCYSLCIFLSIILSYFLFEIIKNKRCFIPYFLISIIAFNTHYFMTFILFSNFIIGTFFLKKRTKFILINLFSFLTLLPFLLMTGIDKGLKNDNFNVFNIPDFNFYKDVFCYFAQGKLVSIILISTLLFLIFKRKENRLFYYSFFMIISVFISTFLFSILRPIAKDYYFILLLPYFIILISLMFSIFENKIIKTIVLTVLVFGYFSNTNYILRERAKLLNFDSVIQYYNFDKTKNSALILPHSKEMIEELYDVQNILILTPPQTTQKLIELIDNTNNKVYYFKLEHKNFKEFLSKAYLKYKISYIRLNMDAIIMRVEKREGR